MVDYEIKGKVALVTGCSQGLGYACVCTLARFGVDIFGVSIGDDDDLRKEVEACGAHYHSLTVSLTTPGAIEQVMKEVMLAYGHVDILLNFAGIVRKEATLQISSDSWDCVMDINVKATFFLSQAVIKQFIAQGHGGKIINASSVLTNSAKQDYVSYTTSKGSIEALTKALANEYSHIDIQINAICFGFMTTGSSLQYNDDGTYDPALRQQIPAKRWGSYKDVDGCLLLLASHLSNYISGAMIPIDGGYHIR